MISLGVVGVLRKNEPTYRFWVITRRRSPSSAAAGAAASGDRARATRAVKSRSRRRQLAAPNLSHVAALLMGFSLALLAAIVGLLFLRLADGQREDGCHARMRGGPEAGTRAVGGRVVDRVDVGDAEPAANEDQVDPLAELGCRVEQVRGLVGGETWIGR